MNQDNFVSWKGLIRLHLETIIDLGSKYLDTKYRNPIGTLSVEEIAKNKNHNIMMIELASTFNYVDFDEVKI